MKPKRFFRVKSLVPAIIEIESIDNATIAQFVQIALAEYERKGYRNAGPVKNFLGLAGELAFNECLRELGLKMNEDYDYHERKPYEWDIPDDQQRKYDFKINRGGITIEIATTRPDRDDCLIKDSSWKRSDYAVAVQIKRLLCYTNFRWHEEKSYQWYKIDAEYDYPIQITNKSEIMQITKLRAAGVIGEAHIKGFGSKDEILNKQNGWFYSEDSQEGKKRAPLFPAYCKLLKDFDGMSVLWRLLSL